MHDLLADFAVSKLSPSQELDARLKHAKYYMMIMGQADALYHKGGNYIADGLSLFDAEWAHISAAYLWSATLIDKINPVAMLCNHKVPVFCLGRGFTQNIRLSG